MIKNQDIICFSFSDWEKELISNRFHILTRFAKNNRVFLFERQIYPLWRDRHRFFHFLSVRKKNGIYLITPGFYLPSVKINQLFCLVYYLVLRSKYKFKRPIFWFYNYRLGRLIDILKPRLSCYHCTEDYIQSSKISPTKDDPEKIEEEEKKLVKKVNLVFAVSSHIASRLRKTNKHTFLTINAVDYEFYKKAQAKAKKRLFGQKPVLGYSGNISDKVAFDLLYLLAHQNKYTLLLIGPVQSKSEYLKRLKKMQNVIFLGKQDLGKLPELIQQFDVCLMPYITADWFVKASQPLKLYEYLASGKPIVSTPMDCLKGLSDVVYIGKREKFSRLVAKAVKEDNNLLRQRRISLAKENTWDKNFLKINKEITNYGQMGND